MLNKWCHINLFESKLWKISWWSFFFYLDLWNTKRFSWFDSLYGKYFLGYLWIGYLKYLCNTSTLVKIYMKLTECQTLSISSCQPPYMAWSCNWRKAFPVKFTRTLSPGSKMIIPGSSTSTYRNIWAEQFKSWYQFN